MENTRWQMWLSALVGVVVFVMPWLLASSDPAAALSDGANWNLWITRLLITLLSLAAIGEYRPWEEWVSVIVGAWLFASPWIFGFTAATTMAWSVGIAGAVLVILGFWALLSNANGRRYA